MTIVLAAMFIAVGATALSYGFFFPQRPLADVVDDYANPQAGRLSRVRSKRQVELQKPTTLDHLIHRYLVLLANEGIDQIYQDLRATSGDIGEFSKLHLQNIGAIAVGLFLVANLTGTVSGYSAALISVIMGSVIGHIVSKSELHKQADQVRAGLVEDLYLALTLFATSVKAGSGVGTALQSTLAFGDCDSFKMMAGAIDKAGLEGKSEWRALADLGTSIGSSEVFEIAESFDLARSSGHQILDALNNKVAAATDVARLSEMSKLKAAEERMSVILFVVLFALVVFLLYPALVLF